MKRLILCLLLCQSFVALAQDIRPFLVENHSDTDGLDKRLLKGKVKSIKTLYFDGIWNAETKSYDNLDHLYNSPKGVYEAFDSIGRLTEYAYISLPAYVPISNKDKTLLVYGKSGKLSKKITDDAIQTFNEHGDMVSYIDYSGEKQDIKLKYASGKKTEEYNSALDEKIIYRYNAAGKLESTEVYGGMATLMAVPGPQTNKPARQFYTYDVQNRLLAIKTDNPTGFSTNNYSLTNTYGAGKNPVRSVINQPDGSQTVVDFKDGLIVKKTVTYHNGEKKVSDYRYDYDAHGNWIKMTVDNFVYSQRTGNRRVRTVIAEKEIDYYE